MTYRQMVQKADRGRDLMEDHSMAPLTDRGPTITGSTEWEPSVVVNLSMLDTPSIPLAPSWIRRDFRLPCSAPSDAHWRGLPPPDQSAVGPAFLSPMIPPPGEPRALQHNPKAPPSGSTGSRPSQTHRPFSSAFSRLISKVKRGGRLRLGLAARKFGHGPKGL
jgi:hypothetical protein